MAKVTRVPQYAPDKILLELDLEEAELLYAMLNCCDGYGTRNILATQVFKSLWDANVRSDDEPYKDSDISGCIYFKEDLE
jgi:hypothetical protein